VTMRYLTFVTPTMMEQTLHRLAASIRGAVGQPKTGRTTSFFHPSRGSFQFRSLTLSVPAESLDEEREDQPMAGGTAETKAAKFSRLASARVKRAVKAINLVGALASAQYEKTPAQVDKIETYLNAAVRAAVARLRGEAEADPPSKFNIRTFGRHSGDLGANRWQIRILPWIIERKYLPATPSRNVLPPGCRTHRLMGQ
jgi:hypothetical protein